MKKPVLGLLILVTAGFIGALLAVGIACIPLVLLLEPLDIDNGITLFRVIAGIGFLAGVFLGFWVLRRKPKSVTHASNPRLCLSCGYDLFGSNLQTCPECGSPIPPRQRAILSRLASKSD